MSIRWKLLALTLLSLGSFTSSAAMITANISNIGGNTWQAEYEITNNTLVAGIEEFSIWYDVGLYENITSVSAPADWDIFVDDPIPGVDDGLYDGLTLGANIGLGDLLGGFVVNFDWLGGASEMTQYFEVVDPGSLTVLESGRTRLVSVPEPAPVALFLFGLLCTLVSKRKSV